MALRRSFHFIAACAAFAAFAWLCVAAALAQPANAVRTVVLRAPAQILEGYDIPLYLAARGARRITVVMKIGPRVLERRWFDGGARHVVVAAPPVTGESRIVTIRAFARGFRPSEATVVTVPERP